MITTSVSREFNAPDLGCTLLLAEQISPPSGGLATYRGALWHGEPGDEAAAAARAATYLDAAGRLARAYDPTADDHLRIYGVPGVPVELVGRYLAHRPPTGYDWSLADLQKHSLLRPSDKGDISLMTYSYGGQDVCRRVFAFAYSTDADGAIELTVTETPGWARNDGTWVDGETKTQIYRDTRYNAWRDSARQRIYEGLKAWLPRVLLAIEEVPEVSTVPEGEALTGAWLGANHAAQWQLYMASGRKEAITASLTADQTAWLSATVPAGVVEGVSGGTVREMILGALR